jgi:hypothetical protein
VIELEKFSRRLKDIAYNLQQFEVRSKKLSRIINSCIFARFTYKNHDMNCLKFRFPIIHTVNPCHKTPGHASNNLIPLPTTAHGN